MAVGDAAPAEKVVEVHRIVVRLLDPGDRRLLACSWLWHGDSAEDALEDLMIRLGAPEHTARALAPRATLEMVESAPRRSRRYPILIHVIAMDFVAPAQLLEVLGQGGVGSVAVDDCDDEDRLDRALRTWADGGRLDPLGAQQGQEVLRVQRPGAYAVLHHDGSILLSQLSRARRWTLPGGGVDLGEQPASSLVREVYEEAGLPMRQVALVGVTTARWTGRAPDHVVEDFHAVQFLYTGEVPTDITPQVVEVGGSTSAVQWVALDEVAQRPLSYVARSGLRLLGIDLPAE